MLAVLLMMKLDHQMYQTNQHSKLLVKVQLHLHHGLRMMQIHLIINHLHLPIQTI